MSSHVFGTQGILCLLDAFESEDMDTKLEECMNARWEK